MTWSTLRRQAQALGFDLTYQSHPVDGGGFAPEVATPPAGSVSSEWICVGTYEHLAGLWIRPVTDAARHLSRDRVTTLLENCDPFVEPLGDWGEDFAAAVQAERAAAEHPDWGRIAGLG